jgi:hypothetical protein
VHQCGSIAAFLQVRLTHDYIHDTSKADILYTKFLKDIHNVLNNTVLIFFKMDDQNNLPVASQIRLFDNQIFDRMVRLRCKGCDILVLHAKNEGLSIKQNVCY